MEPTEVPISSEVPPDTYEAHAIKREEVQYVFNSILPWLEESVAKGHGEYSIADIYERLRNGNLELLLAIRAREDIVGMAMVEVIPYPQKRVLNVFAAGGKRPCTPWADVLLMAVEAHARLVEASSMTGYTYPLLAKYAKRHGWKTHQVLIGKEVSNEIVH